MADKSVQDRRPWHLVNTTVRNPYRLKGGLRALLATGFAGDMGQAQEEEMAWALNDQGIIELSPSTSDVTSISRKWRSALIKMGFLWPLYPPKYDPADGRLGMPYTVTPNGRRLLQAESPAAEQEVLLRALANFRLPSYNDPNYKGYTEFSPLRLVIRLLERLRIEGEEAVLSPVEMASVVILSDGSEGIEQLCKKVLLTRKRMKNATSKLKERERIIEEASALSGRRSSTHRDYQDVTFRYLRSTGLFVSKGRSIALNDEQATIAKSLADEAIDEVTDVEYLERLAQGAHLAIDTEYGANAVLGDLLKLAKKYDLKFDLSEYDLQDVAGVRVARHDLLDRIRLAKEIEYANNQINEVDEILAYLKLLDGKRSTTLNGERLTLAGSERPAYFEWAVWRALLALNRLVNPPYEVRRFNVDQDFHPISHAPGGGADLMALYDKDQVVVEVTLTSGSRQVAAEREPVQRHVAEALKESSGEGLRTYGLFIAPKIDINTVEGFRHGIWYYSEAERVKLDIVPLSLSQFRHIFVSIVSKSTDKADQQMLLSVIRECIRLRDESTDAPDWYKKTTDFVASIK